MEVKVKYERKVGEPTTCVSTVTVGSIIRVFETPNADAHLTALENDGKLGVELPE